MFGPYFVMQYFMFFIYNYNHLHEDERENYTSVPSLSLRSDPPPCILNLMIIMIIAHTCGSCIILVLSLLNGPRRDKTAFGVSDKASFKPVSSATETS